MSSLHGLGNNTALQTGSSTRPHFWWLSVLLLGPELSFKESFREQGLELELFVQREFGTLESTVTVNGLSRS
jgi:hypothetical protein